MSMEKSRQIAELTNNADASWVPNLVLAIQEAEEKIIWLVEHFREGTVPEDTASAQHVANSNRAFGADSALYKFYEAIESRLP